MPARGEGGGEVDRVPLGAAARGVGVEDDQGDVQRAVDGDGDEDGESGAAIRSAPAWCRTSVAPSCDASRANASRSVCTSLSSCSTRCDSDGTPDGPVVTCASGMTEPTPAVIASSASG